MLSRSTPIVESVLRGLHPESIDCPGRIRALLESAGRERIALHRGLNSRAELETAFVESVESQRLILRAPDFDNSTLNGQVFLNFYHRGRPYFFTTRRSGPMDGDRLIVCLPDAIYYSERRDRPRRTPDLGGGDPRRVELAYSDRGTALGYVEDVSPDGIGLIVPGDAAPDGSRPITVRFLDGSERGREAKLQLRNRRPVPERHGWTRIGLVRSESAVVEPIEVEQRDSILGDVDVVLRPLPEIGGHAHVNTEPQVVRIPNAAGEEIVGLLDHYGESRGAVAVVMPGGWGQTKEALLPLARTLVASFRAHDRPIVVVRYDGVRKRGESYNDPECRVPGHEYHHFVFSQGVGDLESVVRHLRESPTFGVGAVVVTSFSAAAIEVRKAIAKDRGARIDGWVSVAGSPDLQSMARSISGGVDFVGGHERGARFGLQELLGVTVDIDRIAVDAVAHEMSYIEQSRRDFAAIDIPITWLHGRYDAWVDLERVRDVLSHGNLEQRRLIVIPSGHRLKTSRQAKEAFQLIAREVSRMALGEELMPVAAPVRDVRVLRLAEQLRRPDREMDLRGFWRDYLIGRDRSLGIELLTSGSAYRALMRQQLDALRLEPAARVADLGSGTGAFALALKRSQDRPEGVRVVALDHVKEALSRARHRLGSATTPGIEVIYAEADLDLRESGQRIPVAAAGVDRVLASLLLGYLEHPDRVLAEIYRILRPGGRVVISTLCRDADISRLYAESYAELQVGYAGHDLPELRRADLGRIARNFLNDAARILELEEEGAFHFWDPEELHALVSDAGFVEIETGRALGTPPQAVVLSATRPREA
ncbi:MAG: methyltransferase domain-containing protein [Deltaproteobacteria bacterium]|nr:methyltransferase domain-containing protein [Deltaproteobacteria bacterium]MBW2383769.1 methyltransferase domain-containing protein [Deltaproteobacteria bacterium]MBW2695346.1 methyltransferase domain-containing protein [Deltaproteobacteria bacterium]